MCLRAGECGRNVSDTAMPMTVPATTGEAGGGYVAARRRLVRRSVVAGLIFTTSIAIEVLIVWPRRSRMPNALGVIIS